MPQPSRTFRVFVSSTFSDLKAERNALQERVFPRLRELCAARGTRFQAIDLRWGVSEEAALDQQTMDICLREIARCQEVTPRPNFVVLLGDRYGWQPPPPQVPGSEFEQILHGLSDDDAGMLHAWYRRDDNAVPPEYVLQPRERGGPYEASGSWERVEEWLHKTLASATEQLNLPDEDRVKYWASATHQEIVRGALRVEDAPEHVFCFFRNIEGLPKDRSSRDFHDLDPEGNPDSEARERLEQLREELGELLPGSVHEYEVAWTGSGVTTDHIGQLCDDVYESLSGIIVKQIARMEAVDPLDAEVAAHEAFGEERATFFTGRVGILEFIGDYVRGEDRHPLAVWGESGSGKSALMARAVQQVVEAHPEAELIYRFIGATPDSSNGRSLLEGLCRETSRRYMVDESTVASDYRELVREFPQRMALATAHRPLILFLDALDQLSDAERGRKLAWLPPDLPEHVRLIVSTIPGECRSALERQLPRRNLVKLEPMLPGEGTALLDLWLAEAGRTLQPEQRADVAAKFERCGLPLYLKLAFEEARRWRSYDGLPRGADERHGLSGDVPGVIRDLLWRLSQEVNHGQVLVARSLGYLAAAKNGVAEDELLDLLSTDKLVVQDFLRRSPESPKVDRLPVVVWSRLYADVDAYVAQRAADGTFLMAFYHRQLDEVIAKAYLTRGDGIERHHALARYFAGQPLETEGTPNLRKLSEQPHQQMWGQMWQDLEGTLCDLRFLEAKCSAGRTYDLIADYTAALAALPGAQEERRSELEHQARINEYTKALIAFSRGEGGPPAIMPSQEPWSDEVIRGDAERTATNPAQVERVRAFAQFVSSESDTFVRFSSLPGFCIQQAHNSARDGPVASAVDRSLRAGVRSVLLGRHPFQHRKHNPHPALLRTLTGHRSWVNSVSITADGRIGVSGGADRTVRLWDLESGECLTTLDGHTGAVTSVSVTPDGHTAVSASEDATVRVWFLDGHQCRRVLDGPSSGFTAVDITPDGARALAGCDDGSLWLWDLHSGHRMHTIRAQTGRIRGVRMTPDARIAVCGAGVGRVWDIVRGVCVQTLEDGRGSDFQCLSITPDGRLAVSGGATGRLRAWDIETGECLRTLGVHRVFFDIGPEIVRAYWVERGGHRSYGRKAPGIVSVSVTPDGRVAVCGCDDTVLRVWDLRTGEYLRRLGGHGHNVTSVAITPDGRSIVSASGDGTVRVWDLEKGNPREVPERPRTRLYSVSLTPDATRAVTGSRDHKVRVWDLESGECIKTLGGHRSEVRNARVAPDGKTAVSFSRDGIARLWDLRNGDCLREIDMGSSTASLAAHRRRAVTLGFPDRLEVWDLVGGGRLRSVDAERARLRGTSTLVVTPDGRLAVSANRDKNLCVWDLSSGKCIRMLCGHTSAARAVAVTPCGRRAISGGWDRTLRLWDLASGECLRCLEGHTDDITALCVTPDGTRVVSASHDRTIRAWDLEHSACVAVFPLASRATALSEVWATGYFACGTDQGEVCLLAGRDLIVRRPVVTAVVARQPGEARTLCRQKGGATAVCLWCGCGFPVRDEVLRAITAITSEVGLSSEQSPCLELPATVWKDQRLVSWCPQCDRALRFNPFFEDYRPSHRQ